MSDVSFLGDTSSVGINIWRLAMDQETLMRAFFLVMIGLWWCWFFGMRML